MRYDKYMNIRLSEKNYKSLAMLASSQEKLVSEVVRELISKALAADKKKRKRKDASKN